MIKHLSLAVLLGCSVATYAPAQEISAISSDSMTIEEANAAVAELEAYMTEITEALESVQDPASAEAAAGILMTIKFRAGELQRKMNALTASAPEVQQQVLPRVLGCLVECGQRVATATENIEANNYYDCEALRELMDELKTK